ncbi:MAG: hypothetical protein A2W90_03720 [Bacteroidetes bacterium GWF2_42_66]|nr:MAG: hypothetical protein A2W92_18640 [Bacteroidetes bacterium GWA2_42_15]OFY02563.1 MAG: hypothetical protein A2W89_22130 [Bacteroidetes bacterium GWE2_42_39]OFY41337.1 MAG: hypothetical protein A2W90_03720 [Bacteroidetes bacterium GWF2_42_66]HAZ04933.1 polysaccharide deacetylase [Marinilabiliales bacterium]HBL75464.1 polysaccharide deacetylase [Prolixibacteraceae bacterium]
MIKSILNTILLIFMLKVAFAVNPEKNDCINSYWPNGAQAAVCLTYDDGSDCHLDAVAPVLEKYGFNGTFYPHATNSIYDRMDEWREMQKRGGHELGNHTLFHPCKGSKHKFASEFDLEKYSFLRIRKELQSANTLLKAIDGKTERTLAYPCCEYEVAEGNFSDTIRDMFTAARAIGPIPEDMDGFNVFMTPSIAAEDMSGKDLIAYVKEAQSKGTVAIFMFHHVGNCGPHKIPETAHQELLEYLAANRELIWTDTFQNVMKHIKDKK